jgi:hypothetical protein
MEQAMGTWKRLAIISFSIGLGIAVGVAILLGSVFWYTSRPKSWNSDAIRAHFNQSDSFVTLEDWYQKELKKGAFVQLPSVPNGFHADLGKMTLQLSYDLENTTRSDYTLQPPSSSDLIPMQRLMASKTLTDAKGLKWSVAESQNHLWVTDPKAVLIPAQQTVRVSFNMDYDLTDENSDAVKVTDWNGGGVQKKIARNLVQGVDAFILIDDTHRYQIELPLKNSFR